MSISSYDYAIFSKFVYGESTISLPDGWEIYNTSPIESDSGYAGQAYINRSTGEVVIAHRGTEPTTTGDLIADLQLALDAIPTQYTNDLTNFVSQVKAQMTIEGLNTNGISYTGHSLGGVLAQLSVIEEFKNGNTSAQAVVFDSPGVTLDMVGEILSYSLDPSLASSMNITNYLTAPNLVNTTNDHDFGTDIRIYPDYDPDSTLGMPFSYASYLIDYTLQQHDMLGIIAQFSTETGEPIASSSVTSWPSSGYDYFTSYDQNPHYWDVYFAKVGLSDSLTTIFINTNLGGSHDLDQIGVAINGDNTNNNIWGATNAIDIISGQDGDDIVFGYGGNDELDGGAGSDTLDGGSGNDILEGGSGSDTYLFNSNFGRDVVDDNGLGDGDTKDIIQINSTIISGEAQFYRTVNGNNIYQMSVNGNSYQLQLIDDQLTIISGSSDTNSIAVNNFSDGDYGITLGNIPDESQVNTYTAGNQLNSSITNLSNGNFVISWTSDYAADHPAGMYIQIFDASGGKLGAETFVDNAFYQNFPITALDNGGFVISWTGEDEYSAGIFMKKFDASGNELGEKTLVNTNTYDSQSNPSIATLSNGDFVISWDSPWTDSSGLGVCMQRFDANGNKLGVETLVNTYINNAQTKPSVSALNDGGFVISWQSNVQDGSGFGVYIQRFNVNGEKLGTETLVNTYTNNTQYNPTITTLTNGFMVAWSGQGEVGYGTFIQQFDDDGNRVGAETLIISNIFDMSYPSITALNDGGFVASWFSTDYKVYAQRYDSEGYELGTEILLSTNGQTPSITSLDDGNFVVSWTNFGGIDGDGYGAFMQIFNVNGEEVDSSIIAGSTITSDLAPNILSHLSESQIDQINNSTYIKNQGSDFSENITSEQNSDNNFIDAGRGDDNIITFVGNDIINAGNGNDTVQSGAGNDIITGGNGNDTIISGLGSDLLKGGAGNDMLDGGGGVDIISGGEGNDIIYGKNGDDQIIGRSGKDTLIGGQGNDTLSGGKGNDTIYGKNGDDQITGGLGKDTLIGGQGNDTFNFYNFQSSTINRADTIKDFTQGQDKINLSHLEYDHIMFDENADGLEQGLSYYFDNENNTIIEDQANDFAIKLIGHIDLNVDDFGF